MIKVFFKPFFKRFLGLFISMVFVSMLSVGLLCCFGSTILNVRSNYKKYVKDYGNIDILCTTEYINEEKLLSVNEINEVEEVYTRMTFDAYMKKDDRTIVSRIFSYKDANSDLFKLYPLKQTDKIAVDDGEVLNISVTRRFANNNKLDVGQFVRIGLLNVYLDCYIHQIVETAEGIYPRATSYIWSDNYDFGYVYILEEELDIALKSFALKLLDTYTPQVLKDLAESLSLVGLSVPDLSDVDVVGSLSNQILINTIEEVDEDYAVAQINKKLEEEEIEVKSTTKKEAFPHLVYMEHALRQVRVAAIFLPAFFYAITMVVVALFLNQIIKAMTPQIGIFMSIGVDTKEINGLFLLFTTLVGVAASALGVTLGFLINLFMSNVMRKAYSVPTINAALNPWVVVAAIVGLLAFIIVTTLITCRSILSITPKDAVISNESKRKKLPKTIDTIINKAPMNVRLGMNSIFQNPKRFIVSTFSMFTSLVLILLSTLFVAGKDEMINQTVKRRLNYDAQIYLTEKVDETFYNDLKGQDFVEDIRECYFTFVQVDNQKEPIYLECLAIDEGKIDMVVIPNNKGRGSLVVDKEGIILPKSYAQKMNVKKGDSISINNKSVVVNDISYQYFHPITYLSKSQMESLGVTCVTSYIVDVSNENELLEYLTSNNSKCLTVFTKTLAKDTNNVFNSINIMVYMIVGFSLLMAFLILFIMATNALMEQQRPLSVLRLIGFKIIDISHVWTLQSISELVLASLVGVPVGCLTVIFLSNLASSAGQIYPFVLSWPIIFAGIAFVLLVVVLTHILSMYKIYKWNLADNTRTRE